MNNPIISIIIPVYKVENFLHECINSILAQTFKNFEIILINDGSPDRSGHICDEFAEKYTQISVIHTTNRGAAAARNSGIEIAKGDFIMFVDSDDTIAPTMLAELYSVQCRTDVDVVGSRLQTHKNSNSEVHLSGEECIRLLLERKIDSSPCTKLIKKNCIENIRFPEGITNEDVIFLYRLYGTIQTVCYLNKSFYYYRPNPQSVTHSQHKYGLDIITNANYLYNCIEKEHPELKKDAENFKIKIYMDFCINVLKLKLMSKYKNDYNRCRQFCMKNLKSILTERNFSWKYKCKSLLIISIPLF